MIVITRRIRGPQGRETLLVFAGSNISRALLVATALAATPRALAAGTQPDAGAGELPSAEANGESRGWDDEAVVNLGGDPIDYGPWTIGIPKSWQGRGYVLRFGGNEIPLTGDAVTIKGSDERQRSELVAADGRILALSDGYIDDQLLAELHPRNWRVGLWLGSEQVGNKLDAIGQDGALLDESLNIDWQPSPLGLRLSYANIGRDRTTNGEESRLNMSQWGLGVTYDLAPLTALGAPWRRLQLLASVGATAATTIVNMSGNASYNGHGSSFGAQASLELTYPLTDLFWLSARGALGDESMHLAAANLTTRLIARHTDLGVAYTF